jgi:periplasmic protein TonB
LTVLRPLHLDKPHPRPERRAAIVLIAALHFALAWGLLGLRSVHAPAVTPMSLTVELLAADTGRPPATAVPPLPRPRTVAPATPLLEPPPLVVRDAPPAPAPAPAPARPQVPTEPAPSVPAARVATVEGPAPVTVQAPRPIPTSAIQYLVLPDIVYPGTSRRLNEEGLVLLAVFIDEQGMPQRVEVVQSSGFDRLDRAAVAGVRRARFKPYIEDGRPMAGWARIPVPFTLER